MATVNNTNGGVTYGQSTTTVDAPQDSDNDFLCAVQLQRIADSLDEILRLVKKDMEKYEIKNLKKGDKILHSHLGTQPPVSGVVMESPVQGRGVRSTILVDVKGSEVGLFDEIGSIYTSEILKVFRDDNWLPVEQG